MISIVIPVFNEERYVAECLQSLVAQTLPKECFEVIIVDNGSTDSTVSIVEGFCSVLPLQVLLRPGCSIAAVRNHGAAVAKGELFAFLDGDCPARPTWLADSLAIAPADSIWGAHYLVAEDASWVAKVWGKYQATERTGPVTFIPGSCLFIRRADFERIGGFRESVETSEDVEICARAREHGMQIVAYPELAVVHKGTPGSLAEFYRKNRWHGKNVLRLFLAKLPSTRNLPIVALSVYTLVMFWAAIVVPFFAVPRREWWLALLPLGLLLLPAGMLSVKKTASAGSLKAAPALFVLYVTYFLARAAALTHVTRRKRS